MAYNNWFDKNPNIDASFMQRGMWKAHTFGRQQFAKSFARGGIAATMFAPTRKEMLLSPWRLKNAEGSLPYLQNLRKLENLHPESASIKKAIAAVGTGAPRGVGKALAGGALGAAMVALPAFLEDGPIEEKARAVTKGLGSWAGMGAGTKVGVSIGTIVGGPVGGLIGAAAGMLIGSIAGEELTDSITRIPDRMAERERSRRGFNWGQHTAAFQTQRAHTMRQQSLALMNKGSMSSRSLLGQEAMFVHR